MKVWFFVETVSGPAEVVVVLISIGDHRDFL
jgi:hypothetical protein